MVGSADVTEVGREIERPHKQHIDTLGTGNGGDVFDRLGAFDLAHDQQFLTGALDVLGAAQSRPWIACITATASR